MIYDITQKTRCGGVLRSRLAEWCRCASKALNTVIWKAVLLPVSNVNTSVITLRSIVHCCPSEITLLDMCKKTKDHELFIETHLEGYTKLHPISSISNLTMSTLLNRNTQNIVAVLLKLMSFISFFFFLFNQNTLVKVWERRTKVSVFPLDSLGKDKELQKPCYASTYKTVK